MALRTGFTTGTCAAAAAKAAAIMLCKGLSSDAAEVRLPDGSRVLIPILYVRKGGDRVEAAVRKDAGDDPDVTDGVSVIASLSFSGQSGIRFVAGAGVGTVTKPGLSLPPGEPAINPVPRRMIEEAVGEVTNRGVEVTVSIPEGRKLAARTFNPRLGVIGGLSILGTTGIVRPYSSPALQAALKCLFDMAVACGIKNPVFVPGHIGERAARRYFRLLPDQVIEVSNEWGFMLDLARGCKLESLLALGHPGKLAKLSMGEWDTHSLRSKSAVPVVKDLCGKILGHAIMETRTVEGVFSSLGPEESSLLASHLSESVRRSIEGRIGRTCAVVLINIQGEVLGHHGDLSPWV